MNVSKLKLVSSILLLGLIATPLVFAKKDVAVDKKRHGGAPAKEWYMKTTLQVMVSDDKIIHDQSSGIFGKLRESQQGYDKHDIPAFRSTARSQGAIVFVHGEEWGENAGEYLSDYHGSNRQSDSWTFVVNSSHTNSAVTLSWDGLFVLSGREENGRIRYDQQRQMNNATLKKLKLIHLDTLTVIDAVTDGSLNSYTFNMDGKTSHHFRWVLGPINSRYFEPGSGAMRYMKARNREADERGASGSASRASHGKFGQPPQ